MATMIPSYNRFPGRPSQSRPFGPARPQPAPAPPPQAPQAPMPPDFAQLLFSGAIPGLQGDPAAQWLQQVFGGLTPPGGGGGFPNPYLPSGPSPITQGPMSLGLPSGGFDKSGYGNNLPSGPSPITQGPMSLGLPSGGFDKSGYYGNYFNLPYGPMSNPYFNNMMGPQQPGPSPNPFLELNRFMGPFGNGGGPLVPQFGGFLGTNRGFADWRWPRLR